MSLSAERPLRVRRVRPLILRLAFLKDMWTFLRFWLELVLELRRDPTDWFSAPVIDVGAVAELSGIVVVLSGGLRSVLGA